MSHPSFASIWRAIGSFGGVCVQHALGATTVAEFPRAFSLVNRDNRGGQSPDNRGTPTPQIYLSQKSD
jgi:hypothetical protein